MLQAIQTTGSPIVYLLPSQMFSTEAFANYGEEILSLENSTLLPLTRALGNQLKVSLNYDVQSASITGQTINAVMKFPAGFAAQSSGKAELKSTLTDKSTQDLTANVTFTTSAKTDAISNEISIPIKLVGLKTEVRSSKSTETELPALLSTQWLIIPDWSPSITFRPELVNMARIMV
jgi:hypothetical protein